ncbi:MAG: diguanylate cyclase [Roseiflexaceae bacterium]|nr:diguanylate cyclase [Roseiflexaceae bacterium]
MVTLHWRIIALLTWLAFFFNIERVDITDIGTINLASGTYVVGLLAALLPLIPLPLKRPLPLLVLVLSILYAGALLLSPGPILGGVYTYLTLTGAFMLATVFLLSYRVRQALEEFRDAIEMITFSDKGRHLQKINDAQELVDIEINRSRRTERPLSVIVFQTDTSSLNMTMHRLVQEVQRSMMQRYVLSMTAKTFSRYMRRTDIIFEDHKPGRLILLAPEVGEGEATKVGERIVKLVEERLGVTVNYSYAAFPQQALTFEELLNVADQRLQSQNAIKHEDVHLDDKILDLQEASAPPSV